MNRKTYNIKRTSIGNKIADHSDVIGASAVYIFIIDSTPGFNGLGNNNCKTRPETLNFWDLMRLILDLTVLDSAFNPCGAEAGAFRHTGQLHG